jgi:hypothetical protein
VITIVEPAGALPVIVGSVLTSSIVEADMNEVPVSTWVTESVVTAAADPLDDELEPDDDEPEPDDEPELPLDLVVEQELSYVPEPYAPQP